MRGRGGTERRRWGKEEERGIIGVDEREQEEEEALADSSTAT